jgi:hypothetical protein
MLWGGEPTTIKAPRPGEAWSLKPARVANPVVAEESDEEAVRKVVYCAERMNRYTACWKELHRGIDGDKHHLNGWGLNSSR